MDAPAEVVFDRFFQERYPYVPPVRPEDPDPRFYKGRHDLRGLQPSLREQLRSIQDFFNKNLQNEKQGVTAHVDHPPFHIDYLDSIDQNAMAFQYGGYSFIAITLPLIFLISDVCLLLSKSQALAALMGVRPSNEEYNELQGVLFFVLATFIVGHEWAHHVHGHTRLPRTGNAFPSEIQDSGPCGSLKVQIEEVAADGYSAYLLLENLIKGSWRRDYVTLLGLDACAPGRQDEVLLSIFVAVAGAYMLVRPIRDVTSTDIYKETHPPQAARMNHLMHEAAGWCKQNRPELEHWIKTNFRDVFDAAADAILTEAGKNAWRGQIEFFITREGATYVAAIIEGIDAYRDAFGNRRI